MDPLYSASWWNERQVLFSSFGALRGRCFRNICVMFCNIYDKKISDQGSRGSLVAPNLDEMFD